MALTKVRNSMILGDVINVLDYGAVGNNSNDDTAAIQAALTAGAGNVVYFPKGAYRVTSGLSVPNRTTISGAGPISSQIYYRTTATATNQLFDFDNVDNIYMDNIGLVCDKGAGSRETTAILAQGDSGSVTEVKLENVYISDFQRTGIFMNTSVYYFDINKCRIFSTSNSTANGGDGITNAYGIYIGDTINAIRIKDSRISLNDVAIHSATVNQKYSILIDGCYFEQNGVAGAPVEFDTVSLRNFSAVGFTNNYCEANLTGTTIEDSFLKLQACRAANISGNIFAGAFGGVTKSKNLIGIKSSCYGVHIHGNEFQDPTTNYVYVADGTSTAKVERNYFDNFGTPVVTYAAIMGRMSNQLVELDVPLLDSVTTGTVLSGGFYEKQVSVLGVPVDRNCTVLATAQQIGAEWQVTASIKQADVVWLQFRNLSASSNSFTGTVAIRVIKNGSF